LEKRLDSTCVALSIVEEELKFERTLRMAQSVWYPLSEEFLEALEKCGILLAQLERVDCAIVARTAVPVVTAAISELREFHSSMTAAVKGAVAAQETPTLHKADSRNDEDFVDEQEKVEAEWEERFLQEELQRQQGAKYAPTQDGESNASDVQPVLSQPLLTPDVPVDNEAAVSDDEMDEAIEETKEIAEEDEIELSTQVRNEAIMESVCSHASSVGAAGHRRGD
jgi:hypothetical protein